MFKPRLPKTRRASVLIIVIVLLLLLAILGAAYISTSHGDRLSSAQSLLNADADSQIDGIANLVGGTIVDDLNDYVQFNDNGVITTSDNLRYPLTVHAGTVSTYRNSYLGTFVNGATYNIGDILSDGGTPPTFYICTANGTVSAPAVDSAWAKTNRWPGVTGAGATVTPNGDGLQPWLADRIPVAGPIWPNITQLLVTPPGGGAPVPTSILGTLTPTTNLTTFESPDGVTVPAATQYTSVVPAALSGSSPAPAGATYDQYLANDGSLIPALSVTGTTGVATNVIAGDADNDGIADSLLFRIPGAYFDGLTWYAGVRIIDNNSAINANTAFSRDNDYPLSVTGTSPTATTAWGNPAANPAATIQNYYGLFQSGVGLWELLAAMGDTTTKYPSAPNPMPDQLYALLGYRLHNPVGVSVGPTDSPPEEGFGIPIDESTVTVPSGTPSNPTPNTSNAPIYRPDYQYITLADAMYGGLIRRLANPAINYTTVPNASQPNVNDYFRYQALPLSDEAALASHFCLATVNSSNTAQSLLEQYLAKSLYASARATGYYSASAAGTWFSENFFTTSSIPFTAPTQAARPFIVTRNPVSNYVQPVFDATNVGEPVNPRMLPWGTGNAYGALTSEGFSASSASYNHFRGTWTASPTPGYAVNDIVLYNVTGSTTPGYTYGFICVTSPPTDSNPPATLSGSGSNPLVVDANWHLQPWSNHPVKANVNTAPFAELFRAFWCVMAGNPANGVNQPPFNNGPTTQPTTQPSWDYNPYDPTFATGAESSSYLWHQFRSPLRDPTPNSGSPPSTAGNANLVWMDPQNVAVLRAAIAAVNTLGLRDQSQNVISRQVPIQVYNASTTQPTPQPDTWNAEATVFSNAPQPFITEVYATNDSSGDDAPPAAAGMKNPYGYVGIELYNPYPFQMTLTNWQVAVINRATPANGGLYPNMPVSQLSPNPLGSTGNYTVTILPYSYALLENYPISGVDTVATNTVGDATYRPAAVTNSNSSVFPPNGQGALLSPTVTHVYVNNLQNVMSGGSGTPVASATTGGEFILLRPRRADGVYTSSNDPFNTYSEGNPTGAVPPNYYDMVPVDSYDFTGLPAEPQTATPPPTTYNTWSYIRQKPAAVNPPAAPTTNLFLATNGGVYVGNATSGTPTTAGTPRQQVNAQQYPTEVETGAPAPALTTMTPAFGLQFPPPTTATTQPATPPPYPAFAPIQVYNTNNLQGAAAATVPYPTGATSPNPMEVGYNEPKASGTPQGFPFGGFARNGEMLNIPFIGAYRIRSGTYNLTTGAFSAYNVASVVEMNALPMDCAFADDGDSALSYPPPGSGSTLAPPQTADDPYENIGRFYPTTARIQQTQSAATPPVPPTIPTTDYYFWTRRLFDYLTVQSNDNNYMPNTDPGPRDDYNAADPAPLGQQMYYAGPVTQVYNSDGSAPDQTNQDTVGVEGLININTAPASVLALLPLVTEGDEGGSSPATDCQTIANAIVTYRNANGPFMSIFDLNKVPGFQTANVKLTIGTANPQPVAAAANPIPGTDNTLTSTNGVLTPPDTAFPSVTPTASNNLSEDYESDNLVLNRISNMITTRSDTFTVYIVIEGWQNAILPGQTYTAGSNNPKPQLKVVRHYAFIADRSAINQDPSSRFLRTLTVPNN